MTSEQNSTYLSVLSSTVIQSLAFNCDVFILLETSQGERLWTGSGDLLNVFADSTFTKFASFVDVSSMTGNILKNSKSKGKEKSIIQSQTVHPVASKSKLVSSFPEVQIIKNKAVELYTFEDESTVEDYSDQDNHNILVEVETICGDYEDETFTLDSEGEELTEPNQIKIDQKIVKYVCKKKPKCNRHSNVKDGNKYQEQEEPIKAIRLKKRQCPLCKLSFTSKDDLNLHINTVHPNNLVDKHSLTDVSDKRQCPLCELQFSTKDNLNLHIDKVHQNNIVRPQKQYPEEVGENDTNTDQDSSYVCETCGQSFLSKEALKDHTRDKAKKIALVSKPYKARKGAKKGITRCRVCFAEADDRDLEEHFKKSHHVYLSKSLKSLEAGTQDCLTCEKKNIPGSKMFLHMAEHTGEALFECHLCQKQFISMHRLETHFNRVHKKEDDSEVSLEKDEDLMTYIQRIRKRCYLCYMSLDEVTLEAHLQQQHSEYFVKWREFQLNKYIEYCSVCEQKFVNRLTLFHHMAKHEKGNFFNCHLCDKSFDSHLSLKTHFSNTSGDGLCKQVTSLKSCLVCCLPLEGSSVSEVNEHMQEEHSEYLWKKEKFYEMMMDSRACLICGKDFANRQGLAALFAHQAVHTREKLFSCHMCGERFVYTKLMQQHYQQIHKQELNCSVCGKSFSRKRTLKDHQKRFHLTHKRPKDIACHLCDKKFTEKAILEQHVSRVHYSGPAKTHVCDKCGKGYKFLVYLNNHRKQVHDKKKTKCMECGKVFFNEFLFKCHYNTIHLGKRKKTCTTCGKQVRDGTQLKIHMTTHTGVKLFHCEFCKNGFNKPERLKKHLEVCSIKIRKETTKLKSINFVKIQPIIFKTIESNALPEAHANESSLTQFAEKLCGICWQPIDANHVCMIDDIEKVHSVTVASLEDVIL